MDVVPLLCQTTVCHIVRVTLLFYTSLLSGQVIGQESVSLARYLQRTDCRVKQGKVSSSYIASSLEHCTALCKNSPPCVTASWNSQSGDCWLSDISTTDDDPSGNHFSFRGQVMTGWTTNSQIVYGVMGVTGENGRYTLTFETAKLACIERNMTIASVADLLVARTAGYDFCGWGWVSDNLVGMVLQQAYSWCIDPADYHTGFIDGTSWMPLANTYCRTSTL